MESFGAGKRLTDVCDVCATHYCLDYTCKY
jgi:hypothetical protein